MNFIDSILFLIAYVGTAGYFLLWYAIQVSKNGKKQVRIL